MRPLLLLGTTVLSATLRIPAFAQAPAPPPHNVVLFVADGLRFRMVDDTTAPTMAAIARDGVSLRNGHALFPTFTTANASGMATGHMLGDTGDFSNTIYAGFQVPGAGNTPHAVSGKRRRCSATSTSILPAITSTRRRSSSLPATRATAPPRSARSARR